ncbi:hypothetical protein PAPYR_10640 [Paratrimastix pyriformis]|uniref:Uncharacterized protein n=1 Tax=Paratrimastix pyriformis TaxID=342808 RepID=A0ABQ8UAF5_9EUKA|nr:hypothetical protein PAPYR_10640 [Paratrimastix pyriformis]
MQCPFVILVRLFDPSFGRITWALRPSSAVDLCVCLIVLWGAPSVVRAQPCSVLGRPCKPARQLKYREVLSEDGPTRQETGGVRDESGCRSGSPPGLSQPPSPPPGEADEPPDPPRRARGSEPRSPQPLSEAEQDALRGAAGLADPEAILATLVSALARRTPARTAPPPKRAKPQVAPGPLRVALRRTHRIAALLRAQGLSSQPAEGLMDRAFPELEWKSILSNKVGTVYLQRLCLSLGVDYESPSKKTTLIAQLAPLLAERHFTPQKVLQILKLQSWIDISASGFQAPLITPPASAAGSGPAGAAPGPEKSDGPTAPPMQLEVGSTGERSTAVLVTPARSLKTTLRVRGLAVCPRLPPTQQTRNENSPRSGHTSSSRPSSRPSSSSRQQQAQQRQAQQQQAQQQQAQQQAQQQVQQRQAQQRQAQQQQAQQQQAQQQQAQQQAQQQQQQAQQQQQQAQQQQAQQQAQQQQAQQQQQQAQQQQQQAQQQQAQQQAQQQQAQQQQAQQQQAQQQQAQQQQAQQQQAQQQQAQQQQQQRRQRQQQQQQQQAQQQAQQQPSSSRPSSSSSRPSSSRPSSSRPSSPSRRSTRPQRPRAAAGREDIETLLEPNAPDDVLDDILWQVPADWYWSCLRGLGASCPAASSHARGPPPPRRGDSTVHPIKLWTPSLATPEPPPSPQRRIPAGVTNDDGQSCAYAATVQLLAGLRLRAPGPVEASLRGTPVLEPRHAAHQGPAGAYADASELMLAVLSAARRPDLFRASSRGLLCARSAERRHPGRPREHLPAGEQPGPLRVDKCSCGGQLRELSAVKPAPVLVVTVDKLAGVIARAFKTGRLEREGWPSFRLVGGLRHIGSPPLATKRPFSGPTTGPSSTSPGRGGPRDVTTAATILKAAPGQQLRRPPHPVSRPSGTAHPGYSTHLSSTIGPDSTGRPREQLLAPPVDRPASPADVSPSPSDQATTNTPEEEHQDHTGAPLNHNRPRSSEDFVIFYPGAARRWTRGPSPSLSGAAGVDVGVLREPRRSRIGDADGHPEGDVGQVNCRAPRHSRGGPPSPTHTRHANRGHRPAGHRPRGPFELYFPDGAPDGLTPAPTAVRTSREGQAWAVFSSLEDATAARAGASTRVACQPHGGRGAPPRAGGVAAGGGGHTRGATAIRAENTETDDEAGTDEAETGPRGGGSPTPEERPSQNCATDPPRDARTSEHSPTDKRHGLPPRPYSSFPTACPWPSSPLPMAAPFATKSGTTDKSDPVPGPPPPPPPWSQPPLPVRGRHQLPPPLPPSTQHPDRATPPHEHGGQAQRPARRGAQQTQGHRWHLLAACWGPPLEQIRQLEDLLHRPDSGCGFRKPVTVKQTVGPSAPSSLASSSTVLTCILSPRSAPTSPRP